MALLIQWRIFMIMRPIGKHRQILFGLIGICILCVGYEWISYNQHQKNPDNTTIPNFTQLYDGILQITTPRNSDIKSVFGVSDESNSSWISNMQTTMLYQDITSTYSRLFKGMLIGCSIATIVGLLMGCYETFAAFLLPLLSFLAKVPGTAMLAVFFVIVGTGESMFSAMIGFGILPTLTQSIYLSARDDIHDEEINKAYTLGASNIEVIFNVVWKQILPKVIDSIRLQFGPAMVYLIAAEMLTGQVGIGYQIRIQQRLLNMAVVYDYIIILGLTGLLIDFLMESIRSKLCPWYEKLK